MRKIAPVVEKIVRSSDFAMQGLQSNLLNLSAFAKSIQKEVGDQTKKEVQMASIVVTLSRIQKILQKEERFVPKILVNSLSVKPGLVEMVFKKDKVAIKKLERLYKLKSLSDEHLTVTQGLHEISIITVEKSFKQVVQLFKPQKPVAVVHDIASITLQVDPTYTYIRNTFYALLKLLAPRGINVIEVLTTSTEISILVEEKDWEKTFSIFNELFKK